MQTDEVNMQNELINNNRVEQSIENNQNQTGYLEELGSLIEAIALKVVGAVHSVVKKVISAVKVKASSINKIDIANSIKEISIKEMVLSDIDRIKQYFKLQDTRNNIKTIIKVIILLSLIGIEIYSLYRYGEKIFIK